MAETIVQTFAVIVTWFHADVWSPWRNARMEFARYPTGMEFLRSHPRDIVGDRHDTTRPLSSTTSTPLTLLWAEYHRVYIQGGPKSKPLSNDQQIELNRIKGYQWDCIIGKLKYESSTIILFVGVRYSMHGLLSDLNNYALPANQRYESDTVG